MFWKRKWMMSNMIQVIQIMGSNSLVTTRYLSIRWLTQSTYRFGDPIVADSYSSKNQSDRHRARQWTSPKLRKWQTGTILNQAWWWSWCNSMPYFRPPFPTECPETPIFICFTMCKWRQSQVNCQTNFQRWSGYIDMPTFRQFLPCIFLTIPGTPIHYQFHYVYVFSSEYTETPIWFWFTECVSQGDFAIWQVTFKQYWMRPSWSMFSWNVCEKSMKHFS